jgi:hypothetical protein
MLKLVRAKEVCNILRLVVGDNHAFDATFVAKMRGEHVGE